MKFSELDCCPFCGSDTFYSTSYVKGTVEYYERFDGEEVDNGGMYDNLLFTSNKRIYCTDCGKYLGDNKKRIVGNEAEKAYKKSKGL